VTGTPPPDLDAATDAAAMAEFAARYGDADLGPVCIVIAAFREARSLPAVLGALPAQAAGLRTKILVVDDGSDDGTADVARESGAFVCRAPVNRGQGAALRLGYRVAARSGAAFVVTTDADGQYDPDDIDTVLRPVVEGDADFVSGSRRLGSTYRGDDFRRLGVVTYAKVISILTRRSVTDPSFGLRAMRVEVPAALELDQPQYQAAELLIGAAMRGFRIAEVPATMRPRSAGKSRKGPDLLYGARFGRVVVTTWWRERRRRSR
jgi:glycosyltransferase involved in cell wall biosynthesis